MKIIVLSDQQYENLQEIRRLNIELESGILTDEDIIGLSLFSLKMSAEEALESRKKESDKN